MSQQREASSRQQRVLRAEVPTDKGELLRDIKQLRMWYLPTGMSAAGGWTGMPCNANHGVFVEKVAVIANRESHTATQSKQDRWEFACAEFVRSDGYQLRLRSLDDAYMHADVWVVEGIPGGRRGQICYRNCTTRETTTSEPVKYFLARHAPEEDLQLAVLPGGARGAARWADAACARGQDGALLGANKRDVEYEGAAGLAGNDVVVAVTEREVARLACAAATLLQVLVHDSVPNQVALVKCEGVKRLVALGTSNDTSMQAGQMRVASAGALKAVLASKDRTSSMRPTEYAAEFLLTGGLSLCRCLAYEDRPEAKAQASFLVHKIADANGPPWHFAAISASGVISMLVDWIQGNGLAIEVRAEAAACLRRLSLAQECRDAIFAANGPETLQQVVAEEISRGGGHVSTILRGDRTSEAASASLGVDASAILQNLGRSFLVRSRKTGMTMS